MSVKIRLMRTGKKKQPAYRVVVADSRSPRDGRFIEILGHYAPRDEPSTFVIDEDRTLGWLTKGAIPTEQVSKLLDAVGVWDRFEKETGRAPKTKFVISGPAAAKVKQVKAAPDPEPAPPVITATAPEPAPEAEAPVVEEAVVDEPVVDEPVAEVEAPEVEPETPAAESETEEDAE